MHRLIASWFGTGRLLGKVRGNDAGSGTVASLFAAVVALFIGARFGWVTQIAATVIIIVLSVWSARRFVEDEGDAGWIVIDEAAGMFLALIGLSLWPGSIVAFVVFRAADVFKGVFPGVAAAERLPGAIGVTTDDLVAGLYALAAGHIVQTLF
ncbi:MAG: phosphatidylglycerophosphatase A [Acidimicrobiia bacterium]